MCLNPAIHSLTGVYSVDVSSVWLQDTSHPVSPQNGHLRVPLHCSQFNDADQKPGPGVGLQQETPTTESKTEIPKLHKIFPQSASRCVVSTPPPNTHTLKQPPGYALYCQQSKSAADRQLGLGGAGLQVEALLLVSAIKNSLLRRKTLFVSPNWSAKTSRPVNPLTARPGLANSPVLQSLQKAQPQRRFRGSTHPRRERRMQLSPPCNRVSIISYRLILSITFPPNRCPDTSCPAKILKQPGPGEPPTLPSRFFAGETIRRHRELIPGPPMWEAEAQADARSCC
ncbi:uncharacterized protein [Dasypus novemcinctus]|uniref:uncharacterized protein n=1 Tax=Dasypus novemcinctus TaxID=9361 RepID=UPI0039C92621